MEDINGGTLPKAHIAIDPGKTGFLTLFVNNKFHFYAMPKEKVSTGEKTKTGKDKMKSQFSESGLIDLTIDIKNKCKGCYIHAVIEKVTGRNGWAAEKNFSFGKSFGLQKFILLLLKADIKEVRPQAWQSFIYQKYDMIKVPSSTGKTMVNDTKAMSAMVAKAEYPNINFSTNGKTETINHNKTDSFLMCLYSIRRNS